MAAGNYTRAATTYADLARRYPENSDVKRNLGLALHSAGEYQNALKCFQDVLKHDPEDKAALLFSGIEFSILHEPAKAISNLSQFLREDRRSESGFLARGRAYLLLDNFSAAAKDFSTAVELNPENPKGWEGLGKSYLLAADAVFREIDKQSPFTPEWYALLARSYLSGQDYKGALRFFQQSESRDADLPGIHEGLAEVYRHMGSPDLADEENRKADQATKGASTAVRRKYLDVLDFQQRAAEALDQLSHHPETPEYHALLGLAYRIQNRHLESINEFKQAAALSPNSLTLKLELATSFAIAHDCQNAEPLLREVLSRDTKSAMANQQLGECLLEQNRLGEAISYLSSALKEDPHFLPAEASLGRAYLHTGMYRDAIIHLQKAATLGEPATLYQLSEAYRKLGDQQSAAEYLSKYKVRVTQLRDSNPAAFNEATRP